MTTISIVGNVDAQHQLTASVPGNIPPGQVQILLIVTDEDDAGTEWQAGIAREWAADWSDPREDVYSLSDGEPCDEKA